MYSKKSQRDPKRTNNFKIIPQLENKIDETWNSISKYDDF